MKFLSPDVARYLYKSTIRPCMGYCCHVWTGTLVATWNCQIKMDMLDCRSFTFYSYYFGRCSSELAQQVPLPFSRGRSARYSTRLHDFFVTITRCYKDVYANGFFPLTTRLWNSLPIECFLLTYDLNGFKSRINRHILSAGSF